GVYAAFWLSNYQQHRQDAERRERGTRSRGVSARAGCRRHAAAASVRFHDRLQPGRLRHAASIRRHPAPRVGNPHRAAQRRIGYPLGLSRMARYQKLSDELIMPNLDQNISFFYDPVTKKLRKRFEIYPEALQATVKFANELERTHTELLKRIQAERQYH